MGLLLSVNITLEELFQELPEVFLLQHLILLSSGDLKDTRQFTWGCTLKSPASAKFSSSKNKAAANVLLGIERQIPLFHPKAKSNWKNSFPNRYFHLITGKIKAGLFSANFPNSNLLVIH